MPSDTERDRATAERIATDAWSAPCVWAKTVNDITDALTQARAEERPQDNWTLVDALRAESKRVDATWQAELAGLREEYSSIRNERDALRETLRGVNARERQALLATNQIQLENRQLKNRLGHVQASEIDPENPYTCPSCGAEKSLWALAQEAFRAADVKYRKP